MAKETAGQAHARNMGDSLALLDLIRSELIQQSESDREEGIHWGHVGSASHYRSMLRDAFMQMRVVEDEGAVYDMIDKRLAAIRKEQG